MQRLDELERLREDDGYAHVAPGKLFHHHRGGDAIGPGASVLRHQGEGAQATRAAFFDDVPGEGVLGTGLPVQVSRYGRHDVGHEGPRNVDRRAGGLNAMLLVVNIGQLSSPG